MNISLIGSGNVATVLGRKATAAGHRILQVYSRQIAHAQLLADELQAEYTSSIQAINKKVDLTIVALRDDVLDSFLSQFGQTSSVLVHTAGAIPLEVLQGHGKQTGVLYPLQSLRKDVEIQSSLTMLVDGSDNETRQWIAGFAAGFADRVRETNDQERLKYHLAATVVNNFSNHLFALAENFCVKEHISFDLLQPILEETVMRLRKASPDEVQTGPAYRNDEMTIQTHRSLLEGYPDLLGFYELFTEKIREKFSGRSH